MRLKPIAIVGPTACGKTHRAVAVAKALDGEIVSADSRQVYRRMDVGTGKDIAEYEGTPYHLIDVADPGHKYNLYEYLRDANAALASIWSRGLRPIIVGGSGMYLENLIKGTSLPEVPQNPQLREQLKGLSISELKTILEQTKTLHNTTDIDTAQRAIRAIEIEKYYLDNPDQAILAKAPQRIDTAIIGIDIDRGTRRQRITERLRRRLDSENMLDEVKELLDSGVDSDSLIYYGLEYKYLTLHILGKLSRSDMERELETAIHQFAKRQMTWLRGMERRGFKIHWIDFNKSDSEFIAQTISILQNDND